LQKVFRKLYYKSIYDLQMTDSKSIKIFECNVCNYVTQTKCNFSKHLLTAKHKQNTNTDPPSITQENHTTKLYICTCGNKYKHRQSLFNHKIKCNGSSCDTSSSMLTHLMKENQEFKHMIIELQRELTNKVVEMTSQISNIATVNNNTINTNCNNHFNLNFFLNETCKNAMNFGNFIDNIDISFDDIESNAKLGFVEGISKIILEKLQQLTVEKRPIHCTDVKREILYVKDEDQWEKNNSHKIVEKGIQEMTCKGMQKLVEWREENPEYETWGSELSELSLMMQQNLIAGNKREEFYPKIIKNIAKETIIEK